MRIPANAIPRQILTPQHSASSARQFDDMQVVNPKVGGKSGIPAAQQPAGSLEVTAGPSSTASLNAPAELSLDGLMAAWGTNDARYDLNNDQTVDVNDLVEFVERFPQDGSDDTKTPPAVDQTGDGSIPDEATLSTPPPPVPGLDDTGGDAGMGRTLEGLYAAWGQNDAMYDLNGDKTVDVNDLVAFMEQMTADETVRPTAAETIPVADTSPDPTGPRTLAGLMAAWGTADTMYDLNGDKTVDVNDLVQLIEEQSNGEPGTAERVVADTADKLSKLMGRVLSAAGFTNQMPSNLGELMDEMHIDPLERKAVVQKLASRFTGGLGINRVA